MPRAAVQHRSLSLGPLEWQVMAVVWESKPCSVRDVVVRLGRRRAYTTIMTTMNRLFQKRLLGRTLVGQRFFYTARITRNDVENAYVGKLVSDLVTIQTNSRAPELIMLQILENLSQHDAKLFGNAMAVITRQKSTRARPASAGK